MPMPLSILFTSLSHVESSSQTAENATPKERGSLHPSKKYEIDRNLRSIIWLNIVDIRLTVRLI